jgi:hypothetical protein
MSDDALSALAAMCFVLSVAALIGMLHLDFIGPWLMEMML